jgi:hypothetical protein
MRSMTTKQKQNLLAYLGYYKGNIDGDWGKQSQAATVNFQKATGLNPDGIFGEKTEARVKQAVAADEFARTTTSKAETGTWWDGIKHFGRAEFACKCGKCGGFPVEPQEKLIRAADKTRDHFGKPMRVTSGVRCATHNANVGGVSNSRHLSGKAMDFGVEGFSAVMVLAYVQKLPEIRYAYAIDSHHVHMDIN